MSQPPFMPGAWKPVFVTNQWSLEGGYLGRPVFLDTRDVDTVSVISAFVKLDKNDEWLLKAVIGNAGFKGGLKQVDTFRYPQQEVGRERSC